jgi:hypothetical protein
VAILYLKRFSVGLAICAGAIAMTTCANATSVNAKNSCNSRATCQLLAERAFHKDVLMPHDAKLVSGGYGNDGLEIAFRLVSEDFSTNINRSPLKCSRYETAVTGRKFCYASFENGFTAAFVAQGLTYDILSTQDSLLNTRVPRLPQALTAVASYGRP